MALLPCLNRRKKSTAFPSLFVTTFCAEHTDGSAGYSYFMKVGNDHMTYLLILYGISTLF